MLADLASTVGDLAIIVPELALVAFFAFWIHRSEGNRALTMGLYIVFGALAWFGFLYGLGSLYREYREGEPLSRDAWAYMFAGLSAGIVLIPHTRRLLARIIPFDPKSKPDMIGLVLLLSLATASFVQLFFETEVETAPGWTSLVQQVIYFVALAFMAVGVYVTRTPRHALERLGLVRPSARQVGVALALVVVAFMVAILSSLLVEWLQPDVYDRVQENLKEITANYDSVWGAVLLGLASGVGEEVLFRGAIQPRYGIVFTSLVFALLHIQYDASFIVVGVFAAGVVFGIERQRLNTTSSIITHAVYNIIAVLLTV